MVSDLENPIEMHSANGVVIARQKIRIYIKQLDITVEALILDEAPNGLAMGLLCTQEEFHHIWYNKKVPYLENARTSAKVYCHNLQNVPTVTPAKSQGLDGAEEEEDREQSADARSSDQPHAQNVEGAGGVIQEATRDSM